MRRVEVEVTFILPSFSQVVSYTRLLKYGTTSIFTNAPSGIASENVRVSISPSVSAVIVPVIVNSSKSMFTSTPAGSWSPNLGRSKGATDIFTLRTVDVPSPRAWNCR